MLDWVKRGVFGRDLSRVRSSPAYAPAHADRSKARAVQCTNAFVAAFLALSVSLDVAARACVSLPRSARSYGSHKDCQGAVAPSPHARRFDAVGGPSGRSIAVDAPQRRPTPAYAAAAADALRQARLAAAPAFASVDAFEAPSQAVGQDRHTSYGRTADVVCSDDLAGAGDGCAAICFRSTLAGRCPCAERHDRWSAPGRRGVHGPSTSARDASLTLLSQIRADVRAVPVS